MRCFMLGAAAAVTMASGAGATSLDLVASYGLADQLSQSNTNFHPQGLGYDAATGQLLFAQQSAGALYFTDLEGVVQGSRSVAFNHVTSVAADASSYYFSDYSANSDGLDVYALSKSGGAAAPLSTEIAAYGGYPIDVRDGKLYRTDASAGYGWGDLGQLRISSLLSPDTIDAVVTLETTFGIGDIAVDLDRNALWALDYSETASIRQFDLTSGLQLAAFDLGLDGLTAGLTYADNRLYYYDWTSPSGSTLSVYALDAASVPLPASGLLLAAGLGAVGWMRRHA
tara:strand:+ start:2273 stop:3124 length:852 start_codon:yes stop_codon:yes gene_type:complete